MNTAQLDLTEDQGTAANDATAPFDTTTPTATSTQVTVQPLTELESVKALSGPDVLAMSRSAGIAERDSKAIAIVNEDDYQAAAMTLQDIKGTYNRLESQRTAITGPLNAAMKAINALFRGPMDRIKAAEDWTKDQMLNYTAKKEAEAAAARAEAERIAEVERRRAAEAQRVADAAALAERQRVEAEARRNQEAEQAETRRLQQIADDAAAAGNAEAAAAAAQAAETEARAAKQRSELIARQAAEQVAQLEADAAEAAAEAELTRSLSVAPVLATKKVAARGTSVAKTYDFEVTNLTDLVKHIAENPALINLVMHDPVKLRAYVKGLGANTNLPGVHVYEKRTLSSRAA